MVTFAIVAHRATSTNTRLGALVTPAQAIARLGPRDVAPGRLEANGAVDFSSAYSLTDDVFAVAGSALRGVVVEPAAGLAS
jgi:hypothetical protein